jgi:hypothetical protein
MKPVLESVYGSAENVDNIIAQIRNDYVNPNYHGYNFMYASSVGLANEESLCDWEETGSYGGMIICFGFSLRIGSWG